MKTFQRILASAGISFLNTVSSVLSLFMFIIPTQTSTQMQNIPITTVIAIYVLSTITTFIVSYLIITYLERNKTKTIEILKMENEYTQIMLDIIKTADIHKFDYLFACLRHNKIYPEPQSWLSKTEKELFLKLGDKIGKDIKSLYKELNIKIDDEYNPNNAKVSDGK